jgi:protein gp37
MGSDTAIEWCDHTFNPWWGCQRVSPGCEHCYAEAFAKRVGFNNRSQTADGQGPIRAPLPLLWGPGSAHRFFGEKHWAEPLKWNEKAKRDGVRRRVFCASMADVFEDREDLVEPREQLWDLVARTEHLDWLVLTKRPENIARMIPWGPLGTHRADPKCWWNVWLGTTAEDQQRADERIPELLTTPAAVRFVSYEPALGAVDFARISRNSQGLSIQALVKDGFTMPDKPWAMCQVYEHPALDWIIVGGESGRGARPFDVEWARSTVAQCKAAGVACFVKQLGAKPFDSMQHVRVDVRSKQALTSNHLSLKDRKGGDMSEWPEELRVRQFPEQEGEAAA